MKVGYLGRRLASAFVTILLIALINFLLFRAMPGSPERILMRNTPNVTEEMKQAARVRWGLDKPVFPDQLIAYFQSTARGDLGFSFAARGAPVLDVISARIWPTIILFGLGELLAIIGGLALGAYTGWKRGGWVDQVGNGLSLVLYATPYFLLGMAFLLIFGLALRWFPTYGMLPRAPSTTASGIAPPTSGRTSCCRSWSLPSGSSGSTRSSCDPRSSRPCPRNT